MKVLIDVDKLEAQGAISADVAQMLRQSAIKDTGSTAINLLLAFGAIVFALGFMALSLNPQIAAGIGAVFIFAGWHVSQKFAAQWAVLGSIWMIVGALILSGAIGVIIERPLEASLIAAVIVFGVGILASSKLLIALTPLALSSVIGGSTGYWHATYMICIEESALTVVLFSMLAYLAFAYSKKLSGISQDLAIVFARMCVILVNMGFWVGSLWGDVVGSVWRGGYDADSSGLMTIPSIYFVVGWAIALILAGAWAAKEGRRFMVNTVAVFASIHFYTQWFELLGFAPLSVMVAGIAAIGIGLALWKYNQRVISVR